MTQPFPTQTMHTTEILSSKPRRSSIAVYELLNHHTQTAFPTPHPLRYSLSSPVIQPTHLPTSTTTSPIQSPIRKHQHIRPTQKTTTRGPWRIEEDRLLTDLVHRYGARHWSAIATHFSRRSGKQARERWMNQLNPALKKKNWTEEEDTIILRAHESLGNRWSTIAQQLPGRTDNSVKNRYNSTLKRAMRERRHANASMDIEDIVSSLHARPLFHDQRSTEVKGFRSDFYGQATKTTMSCATYDSNTSEERDLWVRGGNTNTRMAPRIALAGETNVCLPSISQLQMPSILHETTNNRKTR